MVVFFDIDGTIIDEKTQEIPASAVRAVARLAENGHMPVINTGRPYSHIDPRVKAMAFQGCGGGMEEVKAVAGYVTAPVMEDGIEKALAHFGLL